MKNTPFIYYTVFFFWLACLNMLSGQSQIVHVEADRYYVDVTNIADHHISMQFGRNKSVDLAPSRSKYFRGYYSKRKIASSKITCRYTQDLFEKDAQIAKNNWESTKRNLKHNKDVYEQDNQQIFISKVAAEAGANWKTNYDDNWLEKTLKETVRFFSRSYRTYRNFVEEVEALQGIQTWNDLEYYLRSNYGDYRSQIRFISQKIEKEFDISAESNENIINAAIYYIESFANIDDKYENNLQAAEDRYASRIAFLEDILQNNRQFKQDHTYKNTYKIANKPINFKTKTPNVLLSIDPLVFGNALNKHWGFANEQVLVPTGEDEYTFGDAFHNTSIGGSFKIAVSKEVRLSKKKNVFGRLYAGGGYYRTGYELQGLDYSLSTNFFETSPATSPGFRLSRPLRYEQIDIAGELTWRFFLGKNIIFDLNGGYAKQTGTLNLNNSVLSEGYTWTEDFLPITDEQYAPFYGAKFGIGKNNFGRNKKLKGIHLTGGVQFTQPQLQNTTDYRFVQTSTDRAIGFGSEGAWVYRVFVGVGFGF